MAKYLTLNIAETCTQSWNDMSPAPGGKFCGSCQKTVIDFSEMTDENIARYIAAAKNEVCGRFYTDQLNKEMLIPKKPIPWLKYFFSVTIPTLLFTAGIQAQTKKAQPTTQTSKGDRAKGLNIFSSFPVSGTVTDEQGDAIAGASVILLGTHEGVAADSCGHFKLSAEENRILRISAVGYQAKEIAVRNDKPLLISLQRAARTESEMLAEVVVSTPGHMYTMGGLMSSLRISYNAEQKPETPENRLTIFPNPVASFSDLNFSWANLKKEEVLAEIFSVKGDLVKKEKVTGWGKETAAILLQKLPKGIYILKLTGLHSHAMKSTEFAVL